MKEFFTANRKILFFAILLSCLTPFATAPWGLLSGIIFSLVLGNPFLTQSRKAAKTLLQVSVVGLGFGMNFLEALKAGREGFLFTLSTIFFTISIGIVLGKIFRIEKKIAYLVSVGTAICGGSAIAAVGPVVEAREEEMSVSLGTVFILNSIALFLFPAIGIFLELSQTQFGLWSAIAIHDTSSVVGAAQKFGTEALQTAATVKLERALWIIPVTIFTSFLFKNKKTAFHFPYFIFGFIAAMAFATFVPGVENISSVIFVLAKKGLTVTLFLIGTSLTKETLRSVGLKPLLLGVFLWILVSSVSLFVILNSKL